MTFEGRCEKFFVSRQDAKNAKKFFFAFNTKERVDVFTLRARRLNAGPAGVEGRLPRRPAKSAGRLAMTCNFRKRESHGTAGKGAREFLFCLFAFEGARDSSAFRPQNDIRSNAQGLYKNFLSHAKTLRTQRNSFFAFNTKERVDVFTLRARRLNGGPAGVEGRLPRRREKRPAICKDTRSK